jgi:HEPN domain-containing protein
MRRRRLRWRTAHATGYVPTRYPNGHPEGAPFEHFGRLQSDEAIRHAGEIVEFVRRSLA